MSRVPSLGSCTEKSSLALEATGLTFGKFCGNKKLLSKSADKISHSGTQGRSSNLKRAWLSTMTYRGKNLYIIHKHTCIYTQARNKRFVKQSVLPSYFLSMLFSQNPNAVNCPLHWFLHPLMSPPEVWKTRVWFSKPSYIISSTGLGKKTAQLN